MKLSRLKKYYYLRVQRLKGDPKVLARGAAIGFFIGITPTVPLHTVIILALCTLTKSSVISGLLASWIISNPLTLIPTYYLCLKIGNTIMPYTVNWSTIQQTLDSILNAPSWTHSLQHLSGLGFEMIIVMLTGGIILGLPVALIGYLVTFKLFIVIRRKRKEKQILH
ncbi:MAG: DUF2062 domain-containing protein [Desulfobulbaceae bacterium]|uniref:DUF2062 domain-containing protein n=1 Tax=Candidatus Desulfatifera sulfidica TaxID=2841691 RepID=A0A8J6N6W0_9BACT|nr:DUF2062 domain-containing protein [Candidatus Desulfatifera sulfidica]